MPRDPPVVYLYPLSNYRQGSKGALLEKDSSVKERMKRMAELYKKLGMRRVVEGLLIAHEHSHPFLLLLQIGNTYFKLPGGRLRVGEHETDGLRRKLENKLGCPNKEYSINWQVGELVSTWYRPNFETVMFPYIPPQVDKAKESRKIFLTQLPPTGILAVPKNLTLLAVPLFELFDNAHRYGPVIASLPQLLARVKFVYCDHNAKPLQTAHIRALSLTNIETVGRAHRQKKVRVKSEPDHLVKMEKNQRDNQDVQMQQLNHDANMSTLTIPQQYHGNSSSNSDHSENNMNNMNMRRTVRLPSQNRSPNKNMNGNQVRPPQILGINAVNGLSPRQNMQNMQINPMQINPLVGQILAQNIMANQQRMLVQRQLLAQQMLRPRARIIVTPTATQPTPQNNPPPVTEQLGQPAPTHMTQSSLAGLPPPPSELPQGPNPPTH